ncbi:MAG: Crp/Fnr family transcriptional regulator [Bacteroidetes bacterium]|nr:Crp/Fnr family transcriptional regulator [Bacteroidota bacterium]
MNELFAFFASFQELSSTEKKALAPLCSELKLKKNEELQPIGHTCRNIYFIKKGVARIYYYKDGVDITESFSFEGNVIVRVESLFLGIPSQKAIQVLEESEIVAIHAPGLFRLYDTFPLIERLFRKIFEKGYVETVQRLESLQFHTAEERYKALLNENADVLRRIPLKYIASYLGITQVSLSRIRAVSR